MSFDNPLIIALVIFLSIVALVMTFGVVISVYSYIAIFLSGLTLRAELRKKGG